MRGAGKRRESSARTRTGHPQPVPPHVGDWRPPNRTCSPAASAALVPGRTRAPPRFRPFRDSSAHKSQPNPDFPETSPVCPPCERRGSPPPPPHRHFPEWSARCSNRKTCPLRRVRTGRGRVRVRRGGAETLLRLFQGVRGGLTVTGRPPPRTDRDPAGTGNRPRKTPPSRFRFPLRRFRSR